MIYFTAIIAVFCIHGLHRYWMVLTFLRTGALRPTHDPPERFDDLPRVTVQLPMYNERHVAERIIEAAGRLEYPRDRLDIQVLDDSTDECADIARRACARLADEGHSITCLHRTHRTGFKAGALAEGLAHSTAEFTAVFDADFVPPPDFLLRTIHHFTDERVGMVQTRWSHLNRDDSLLTRIQALCLDGHFVVEQTVRARTGRWFNFNGTAGVWRRTCVDDAGGWDHETLTEDTDLSYRAQLAGWQFRFLPNVTCPAELPPRVADFMSQQHRWNKGLMQTAVKLLPTVLTRRLPFTTKLEAVLHLTSPVPYAAMLLLTLLVVIAFLAGLPEPGPQADLVLGLGVACLVLGTLAVSAFYVVSQWAQGRSIMRAVLLLPALMAVGVGVSVLNTRAILGALFGFQSPFVRTPKYAGRADSTPDRVTRSRRTRFRLRVPAGLVETALGVAMLVCLGTMLHRAETLVAVPFIILFAVGYLAVGLPRLLRRAA